MKIITQLATNNKNRFNGVNPCEFITVHQTGNTSRGSSAQAHANLLKNGHNVTWHYTVDDTNVIQHFNDNVQCWHAGDGRGSGNLKSIGIELCINSDGNYIKTINNGVELIKHLMKKHNIPINKVVQHNYWSGKNCPAQIRQGINGITWNKLIAMVKGGTTTLPVQTNTKLYRVQVGAYANVVNANFIKDKLKKQGFDTFIKKVGNLYKVQVGAYSNKNNALNMLNKLKSLGYQTYLVYN